jgi:hypothetical protein
MYHSIGGFNVKLPDTGIAVEEDTEETSIDKDVRTVHGFHRAIGEVLALHRTGDNMVLENIPKSIWISQKSIDDSISKLCKGVVSWSKDGERTIVSIVE